MARLVVCFDEVGHDSTFNWVNARSRTISYGRDDRARHTLQRALIGTHQVRGLARDQMRLDVE